MPLIPTDHPWFKRISFDSLHFGTQINTYRQGHFEQFDRFPDHVVLVWFLLIFDEKGNMKWVHFYLTICILLPHSTHSHHPQAIKTSHSHYSLYLNTWPGPRNQSSVLIPFRLVSFPSPTQPWLPMMQLRISLPFSRTTRLSKLTLTSVSSSTCARLVLSFLNLLVTCIHLLTPLVPSLLPLASISL